MGKRLLRFAVLGMLALSAASLTGCTSNMEKSGRDGKTTDKQANPVTLKLYPNNPMSEADFNLLIAEPVKKKYPHITVQMMDKSSITFENLVASGQELDFILMWNGNVGGYKDLNIFEDVAALAKQYPLDLGRFDMKTMNTIKELSDKGEIFGLPYNIQFSALYYNKDIFERFGVPYPKDGMTWDDTVELTRRLSRLENGVEYSGLDIDTLSRLTYPLSLIPVDAKTNKATVDNAKYKQAFELGKQLYSIPNNPMKLSISRFKKDKTLAMIATVNILDQLNQAKELNWDMAQYPSYKETPNTYGMYDLHLLMVSKTSKHKEEAMKVMEVFFSDEIQTLSTSATGRISALTNPAVNKAFGTKMDILKGKNVASLFKSTPAYAPPFSIYHSKGNEVLKKMFTDYVADKMDVNTALRSSEEEINKYISSQAKK
ncbi:ABC transporter substrate-binding protein [Paenibacillus allorhizosphaerae]|uniref:Extracellular solute-binding protein n=1 Tax=Paenibacillus allorhizosphaerae TaxID=2849866 RepID=A0ABN7TH23_9BACL|nr:extracellular solute-binding protein [Paenibacillus allorhizosphaerae]CAG7627361.1 hypothetical protein PAECIP111802_01345 [Paenibacillus allorhizosphaerae]